MENLKEKTFKSVPMSVIKANKGDNLVFTISTNSPDRDADILEPKGCQLKNYKKNSVVLFAHDYHSLPIGKSVNIQALDNHIEAEVEFAPTSFAQEVRMLCEQGFLNAASVGFIPIEAEPIESKSGDDGLPRQGYRYKKWDLLEWSIVPVPSNFEALIQNAKAKGIELPALQEELDLELSEAKITAAEGSEKAEEAKIEHSEEPNTLTIEDSDDLKEIRISSKMLGKLIVDGEPFVEKAGRILSASNEKKIKAARDSLTDVLNQLEEQEEGKTVKADEESPDISKLEEAIERLEILAGMLAAEKETASEPYLELDDELPAETSETFFDVDELAEVIRETIRPELAKLRSGVTGKIE